MAKVRILFADDNKDIREIVRFFFEEILGSREYELVLAINGREAWDILKKNPDFDLIYLDISMPEIDGLTLATMIRKDTILGRSKIVALTAHAMEKDRRRGEQAGFDAYLCKPIYVKDLEEVTKRFLEKKEGVRI